MLCLLILSLCLVASIKVIRESKAPDYTLELRPDYNFEKLSINCLMLIGLTYKTDARKVHQLMHGFTQGETSETWINTKWKRQDGQLDYLALLDQYGGEGNKELRIIEAETLQTSIIYNNY